VQILSATLKTKETRIFELEEKIVKIKVSFADSILKLNHFATPLPPPCSTGPSYASVARSQPANQSWLLIAWPVP
jgi:hypothetical protein